MIQFNRRSMMLGMSAAALAMAGGRSRAFAQSGPITVTAFGGTWETAVRDIFAADFTQKTGVPAEVILGAPAQWMTQIEANKENPPIHALVNSIDLALIAGRSGIVEKISADKVPNLQHIPQRFTDAVEGYGTCFDYGAAGIVYHKRLQNPPRSMVELVEGTKAGKWRASLPGVSYQATKEILIWNLADALGGSVTNVDPAFKALKEMTPNAVFFGSVSQVFEHLQTGEADVGIMFDGRVWTEVDNGAELGFINPAEGGIMSPIVIQKVANTPDVVWEYVNAVLDAGNQTKFADLMNYGVTNSNVVYSDKLKDRVTKWEETRWPPFEEIGPLVGGWLDRWNRELG